MPVVGQVVGSPVGVGLHWRVLFVASWLLSLEGPAAVVGLVFICGTGVVVQAWLPRLFACPVHAIFALLVAVYELNLFTVWVKKKEKEACTASRGVHKVCT